MFSTSEENNFRFSSGKLGGIRGKHRNQQSQVLAELNKVWSGLINFFGIQFQEEVCTTEKLTKIPTECPTPIESPTDCLTDCWSPGVDDVDCPTGTVEIK